MASTQQVTVTPQNPSTDIVVRKIHVPNVIIVNKPFTITALVRNKGNTAGSADVVFKDDGVIIATVNTENVKPNQEKIVTTSHTITDTNQHVLSAEIQ